MKCKASAEIHVSFDKTIDKRKFGFYYTFTAAHGRGLSLRIFAVYTNAPFRSYQERHPEWNTLIHFAPTGRNHLIARYREDEALFKVPELQKLRHLRDVEVPKEVLEAAQDKLKSLVTDRRGK